MSEIVPSVSLRLCIFMRYTPASQQKLMDALSLPARDEQGRSAVFPSTRSFVCKNQ